MYLSDSVLSFKFNIVHFPCNCITYTIFFLLNLYNVLIVIAYCFDVVPPQLSAVPREVTCCKDFKILILILFGH